LGGEETLELTIDTGVVLGGEETLELTLDLGVDFIEEEI
jgi:hypothetical protein